MKQKTKNIGAELVAESLMLLPEQCRAAWGARDLVKAPESYHKVTNVLAVGMGGSALGLHVIQSVFRGALRVPFVISHSYLVPEWVDEDTLVILSSYSGTTEEVLAAFRDAKARHAKLAGIAKGGDLEALLRGAHAPFFKIIPAANPSGAPRLGLGYSIFGVLAILKSAHLLAIRESEVTDAIDDCASAVKRFVPKTSWLQNTAKQVARDLRGRLPLVVGAEHLEGNAHIFQNQLHETAKQFSAYHALPELNHHLLEGFDHPKSASRKMSAIFLHSNLYHPRVAKRFRITEEVFMKQGLKVHTYNPHGGTRLSQTLETLAFSGFVSYYLAGHNRVDPTAIPWVDYFKKKLA